MPGNAAAEVGFFVMHASLYAAAPTIAFRRRNRAPIAPMRPVAEAGARNEFFDKTLQRAPFAPCKRETERYKSEVAVEYAAADWGVQICGQRIPIDGTIAQRAIMRARLHARGMSEEHTHRYRALRQRIPFRNRRYERFVEVEAPARDCIERNGRYHDLRQRCEIEARVDLYRPSVAIRSRLTVRALEEDPTVPFDARDGSGEAPTECRTQHAVALVKAIKHERG